MTNNGEQNEPVQDGSLGATRGEKIAGLMAQIAADLRLRPEEDVAEQVKVRFADSGIEANEHEIAALARTIIDES